MSPSRARSGLGEKARLIGFLAVILVLGYGGSSVFAFLAARDAIRASIERDALPVAAESVYSRIQTDLVEPVFVSSMMANDTFLHDWIRDGERETGAIDEYLGEILRRYGAFTAFLVSERSGKYYHGKGVLKTMDPVEPRDAWYRRVRSMAEPYELNVDPDLAHGDRLTVFVNYRVVDARGEFLGAAGVGIAVDALSEMVARFREEFGTSVYFVDRRGRVVAGSPAGPGPAPALVGEDPALAGAARDAMARGGGSGRYRRGGEEVLLRVLWIPELSWFLFVERPEGASVAGARRALAFNLALCALVLALVLLATGLTVDRFQSRLEATASHDALTGALNRIAFGVLAEQALKAASRGRRELSAAIFDLDEFKRVNDGLGHPAGDAVLVRAAGAAREALRASDMLCRWGGEEFLVLLPDCGEESAVEVAEKLRRGIADATALPPSPAAVTASVGVATLGPGESLQSLVERADAALLAAKRAGRDRVRRAERPPA